MINNILFYLNMLLVFIWASFMFINISEIFSDKMKSRCMFFLFSTICILSLYLDKNIDISAKMFIVKIIVISYIVLLFFLMCTRIGEYIYLIPSLLSAVSLSALYILVKISSVPILIKVLSVIVYIAIECFLIIYIYKDTKKQAKSLISLGYKPVYSFKDALSLPAVLYLCSGVFILTCNI